MNGEEELVQLTMNMCFTLEIRTIQGKEVNKEWAQAQVCHPVVLHTRSFQNRNVFGCQVSKLPNLELPGNALDVDAFKVWFTKTCITGKT